MKIIEKIKDKLLHVLGYTLFLFGLYAQIFCELTGYSAEGKGPWIELFNNGRVFFIFFCWIIISLISILANDDDTKLSLKFNKISSEALAFGLYFTLPLIFALILDPQVTFFKRILFCIPFFSIQYIPAKLIYFAMRKKISYVSVYNILMLASSLIALFIFLLLL